MPGCQRNQFEYDALDLFDYLCIFLKRLEIYTKIPSPTEQRRFSEHTITYTLPVTQCVIEKFAKKLLY